MIPYNTKHALPYAMDATEKEKKKMPLVSGRWCSGVGSGKIHFIGGVAFLDTYAKETKILSTQNPPYGCLFIIVYTCKQLRCSFTGEWIS